MLCFLQLVLGGACWPHGFTPSQSKISIDSKSLVFHRASLLFEMLCLHLISPALSEQRQTGWQLVMEMKEVEEVEHKLQIIVWTGSKCHQV